MPAHGRRSTDGACSLSPPPPLSLSFSLCLPLSMDACRWVRATCMHTQMGACNMHAYSHAPACGAFMAVSSLARMPARAAGRRLRAQQFILLLLRTAAEEGGERGKDQREREPCRVRQPRRLQPPHRHACAPPPAAEGAGPCSWRIRPPWPPLPALAVSPNFPNHLHHLLPRSVASKRQSKEEHGEQGRSERERGREGEKERGTCCSCCMRA